MWGNGVILLCILLFHESHEKTWLRANGHLNETYSLIRSVFGKQGLEVPDCAHSNPKDSPHITQSFDKTLNRPVLAFHIHTSPDNDRCKTFDRQRVEIKANRLSPSDLKGFHGETVTFSWNFWLDPLFQASAKFCHIHQIKELGNPVITITPRKDGDNQILEIIHIGRDEVTRRLQTDDLPNFLGTWIHAREELTYSQEGNYSLLLTRLDNGEELMSVSEYGIDLWRDGIKYLRPKWGIYRSIGELSALRDETVYFDNFCLSKGTSEGEKCT